MFINPIKPVPLNARTPFSVFLVEYRLESFESEMYALESIKQPENFAKCVAKRQAEFLAGRCCAKEALKSLGIIDFDILTAEDRSPIWPTDIAGSITHSRHFAAAAACSISACEGVGIDIEKVFDASRSKLREHICSEREVDYLHSLTSKIDLDNLVTLVFSAKESLYKALYPTVKVFFYFDSVEVFAIDVTKNIIHFRVTKDIGDTVLVGAEFQCHYQAIDQSHYLTYCVIS